jgi:Anti-sigma-K factor rskA/Putative zinc-finger
MESGGFDPHTLAGAYAMDAVADADRASFEQHLSGCAACREEIRGLREATAALATAIAATPRPELKDRTLRAAARIRQLPPAVRAETAGTAGPAAAVGPAGTAGSAAAAETAGTLTRTVVSRRAAGSGRTAPSRLAGTAPKLALAAAAALIAVVVAFAVMMHSTRHQLDQAQSRAHAIAAVLNAPDLTVLTADVRTGGTATVVMSHRRRALVFTAAGLRALPAGWHYELWLMGSAGASQAGPLPAARAGMVGPMVVAGLAAGDSVALTVEPAAGPPRPTAPMILRLALGSR